MTPEEIAKLRHTHALFERADGDRICARCWGEWPCPVAERDAEIERLTGLLQSYGWHHYDCASQTNGGDCDCGFFEVWTALGGAG